MFEASNQRRDQITVDAIVAETGGEERHVIAILQAIQERFNYLPEDALRRVCEITRISAARIMSVATFYSQFRLEPAGKHSVKVCVGTACHVMGAENIVDTLRTHLDIPEGADTDPDRVFTVERVACLGCCMLAPAVQIDDLTYGFVRPDIVPEILQDFLASAGAPANRMAVVGDTGAVVGEVRLCLCSSCVASGAQKIHGEVVRLIEKLRLPARFKVVGCTGMAFRAPLVEILMEDGASFRYGQVSPESIEAVLLRHLRPARLAPRLRAKIGSWFDRLLTDENWEPVTRYLLDNTTGADARFTSPQRHIVTADCGCLAPLDIDEFIRHEGFEAARMAFEELAPGQILHSIETSGLRGRGGAGFPTANKWKLVQHADGGESVIICNGDEGDPGAFMDRQILESFPFRVVEGMMIAAAAVGAEQGYFYIRAEYPLAVERIRRAIAICEEHKILGSAVFGTEKTCRLEVVVGAGAFVCGEETALIAAIEGGRGTPHPRPPYPAEKGLWGRPTLVNNVETYALVPGIVRSGGAEFSLLGTSSSRGTKTFSLAGKVQRSGLIEVPMGMTLRQIVEEIGGGVRGGGRLKAVQVGGPSGGCVPEWLADTPVDYEALGAAGAMMGSGGLVALDDSDCMVDIARYFMAFTQVESCGKCTFCRIGTKRMLEILENLCRGTGRAGDLERLEELAGSVQRGSLCGLGRTAPNPVLSTLEHFRNEYEAHLEGRCPAGRCRDLITFSIDDSCNGCTRCAQHCASGAIVARPHEVHEVDPELCGRCGSCLQVCPIDAVRVV